MSLNTENSLLLLQRVFLVERRGREETEARLSP